MISGFSASNIGQYGIEDFSWGGYSRGSPGLAGFTVAPGTDYVPIGTGTSSPFFDNPVLAAMGQIAAAFFDPSPDIERASLPVILSALEGSEEAVPYGPVPGPEVVVPQVEPEVEFIDPDYRPDYTVYEDAPGGIYEVERAPTNWDEYYRRYEELNRPPEEEDEMFDWLESATTLGQLGSAVGWWGGDTAVAPAPQTVGPGGPAQMPARVTVDTRTGKVTACKRRRRRKLLTESDFNVLLRVATLPNKENVRIVLGKAIGRG